MCLFVKGVKLSPWVFTAHRDSSKTGLYTGQFLPNVWLSVSKSSLTKFCLSFRMVAVLLE